MIMYDNIVVYFVYHEFNGWTYASYKLLLSILFVYLLQPGIFQQQLQIAPEEFEWYQKDIDMSGHYRHYDYCTSVFPALRWWVHGLCFVVVFQCSIRLWQQAAEPQNTKWKRTDESMGMRHCEERTLGPNEICKCAERHVTCHQSSRGYLELADASEASETRRTKASCQLSELHIIIISTKDKRISNDLCKIERFKRTPLNTTLHPSLVSQSCKLFDQSNPNPCLKNTWRRKPGANDEHMS